MNTDPRLFIEEFEQTFIETGFYYDKNIVCITIHNRYGSKIAINHLILNRVVTRHGIRLFWKDSRDAYLYLQAIHKNYMSPEHQNGWYKIIIRNRVYTTISRELINNIIKYNIKEIYIQFDSNFFINWYIYSYECEIEFIVWVFGLGIYE